MRFHVKLFVQDQYQKVRGISFFLMNVLEDESFLSLSFSPQRERLRNIERICCLLRKVKKLSFEQCTHAVINVM